MLFVASTMNYNSLPSSTLTNGGLISDFSTESAGMSIAAEEAQH
jgi:hypothetical protein